MSLASSATASAFDPGPGAPTAADLTSRGWMWPGASTRVVAPFVAPPHEYGPGHRGIDLSLLASSTVLSPADGVVAFTGAVAGRELLTIDHGDGLVTTLEPVASDVTVGQSVARGEAVGELARGGHAAPGALHFGVRLHGAYINPLLLLGAVPRAVLLPCC